MKSLTGHTLIYCYYLLFVFSLIKTKNEKILSKTIKINPKIDSFMDTQVSTYI